MEDRYGGTCPRCKKWIGECKCTPEEVRKHLDNELRALWALLGKKKKEIS